MLAKLFQAAIITLLLSVWAGARTPTNSTISGTAFQAIASPFELSLR
jgi:hypothetical protein